MKRRIGIVGGGNMGEALLSRLVRRRRQWSVTVSDSDPRRRALIKRRYGVAVERDNRGLVRRSGIIILAVKPGTIGEVAREIGACGPRPELIISIAAGIPTRSVEKALAVKVPVVRAMPNMPALAGAGITAVCAGSHAKASQVKMAKEVLSAVGDVIEVKEGLMDAVTAVSGSGPAYFFYLVECMTEAARELGLDEASARKLADGTLIGSAKVLEESGIGPAALREKVTSKGGTTEAAFTVFASAGFKRIVKRAIRNARDRARALSARQR